MSLKPSNAGIYNINALNVNQLWINGVSFAAYLAALNTEDQLDQGQIDEIKQILLHLNTSGLTTEWVVGNNNINADLRTAITALETKLVQIDTTALSASSVLNNDNRNSVLKTAITALETKLAQIDTTALSSSSVLNNDNRNSVLKTRIDGHDTNISGLEGKTRYVTSVQGNDSTPTASTFQVAIGDRRKRLASISSGANTISTINDSDTMASTGDYTNNRVVVQAPNGQVWSYGHRNTIEAIDRVEIGSAFGTGSTAAVNIGAKNNRINIGSIDDPTVGATTTEITIGKRTIAKNTTTNLQGNFYTGEARWESLSKSSALTWTQLGALISTGSLPLWVVSFALTSSIPNFSYSDLWSMKAVAEAGGLIKNGELETSTDTKMRTLTIFDSDVAAVDIVPKEGTFLAKGHISKTTLLGDVKIQTFNGEILLRNNNISASNINWALTEAGDNINALKISNNDVEMIAGAGANGSQVRISNTTGGPIKLRVGTGKLQANAHDALNILNTEATSQVQIGNADTTANRYDATSKMILDHTQLTDGLKVCKASGSVTRVNHDNVNTPSVTLQAGYSGSTTNSVYVDGNANLMYNGQQVAMGSVAASGGGLTYIITAPTTATVTSPNYTPVTDLTMSGTYTPTVNRTVTLSGYGVNTTYQLVSIKGVIPVSSNPVIDGTFELNQHVDYIGNVAARLFAKLYFFANTPASTLLINKTYTSPAGTSTVTEMKGPYIPVPANNMTLILTGVTFPTVFVNSGQSNSPLVCTVINQSGAVLYTFPTLTANNGTTADRIFTPASSPQTITVTSAITSFAFVLTNTAASSPSMSQATALNVNNANYTVANGSSVKMLLYDGTNNKTILTANTAAIYALSLPLPVTPFDITNWVTPGIQVDEFFIQPSGSTNQHECILQFNDGNLSHLHTSIATVSTTPTLAQVLTSGNSAGTTLNMNNNSITSVNTITATTANATTLNATTVAATNITGWNVKELTAGTNITITSSSGNYTINSVGGGGGGSGTGDAYGAGTVFTILDNQGRTNATPTITMVKNYGAALVGGASTNSPTYTNTVSVSSLTLFKLATYNTPVFPCNQNPYLYGTQELKQYARWVSDVPAAFFTKLFFETTTDTGLYTGQRGGYDNGTLLSSATSLKSSLFDVPLNNITFTGLNIIYYSTVVTASVGAVLGCRLCKNNFGTVVYTSTSGTNNTFASGASAVTDDITFTFPTTSVTSSITDYSFEIFFAVGSGTIGQNYLKSVDECFISFGNTTVVRMMIYDGVTVNNPTVIGAAEQYVTSPFIMKMPVTTKGVNISMWRKYGFLSCELYFQQLSGSTSPSKLLEIITGDSYPSHFKSTLRITPNITEVLESGNAVNGVNLDMNDRAIINGKIYDTVDTPYERYVVYKPAATIRQVGALSTNEPVANGGNTPEEDRITYATTVLPRKVSWYNTTLNWNTITSQPSTGEHRDAYMSANGRYMLAANGADGMVFSQYYLQRHTGYGDESSWANVADIRYWKSVCGSSLGNRMYAVSVKTTFGDTENVFHGSTNYGANWAPITTVPDAFKNATTISRVRCDGLGRNIVIGNNSSPNVYISNDFGATWETRTISGSGTVSGVTVNVTGQYIYAAVPNVGIYRSYDFGASFSIVLTSATPWLNMCCSATGQFVVATRSGQAYQFSEDYGASWTAGPTAFVDCAISQNGGLVWFCYNGGVAWSDNNGRTIQNSLANSLNLTCIAMSTDGNYVYSGRTGWSSGTQAIQIREPVAQVRSIIGEGTINVTTGYGPGQYIISGGGAESLAVVSGFPSIGGIDGYANNRYYFTNQTYDFDNYNYDIEFSISQSTSPATLLYWIWDTDVTLTNYQQTYDDWDGGSPYYGPNIGGSILYTQGGPIEISYKGTLQALPTPNTAFKSRLQLTGITDIRLITAGNRTFNSGGRYSKTISTYSGATNNSIAQFNGSHSFSLFIRVGDYAYYNPCNMRITKVKKN